jgi:hypothetical protein
VRPDTDSLAAFIGGFVAAEGCFTSTLQRFTFSVGLGATDGSVCVLLRDFFRVGSIKSFPRRRAHYDDECAFAIRGLKDHLTVTIPFMDAHLPQSYKREQYLVWREQLFEYWEHRAKRVRLCAIGGCDEPRRAKGLCRHHYYEACGR